MSSEQASQAGSACGSAPSIPVAEARVLRRDLINWRGECLEIHPANALRAEPRQFANETASLHCVSGKLQGVRFAQAGC